MLIEDFQSTSTSTNKKKAGEWDTEESISLFILFSKFTIEHASETMGSRLASWNNMNHEPLCPFYSTATKKIPHEN